MLSNILNEIIVRLKYSSIGYKIFLVGAIAGYLISSYFTRDLYAYWSVFYFGIGFVVLSVEGFGDGISDYMRPLSDEERKKDILLRNMVFGILFIFIFVVGNLLAVLGGCHEYMKENLNIVLLMDLNCFITFVCGGLSTLCSNKKISGKLMHIINVIGGGNCFAVIYTVFWEREGKGVLSKMKIDNESVLVFLAIVCALQLIYTIYLYKSRFVFEYKEDTDLSDEKN